MTRHVDFDFDTRTDVTAGKGPSPIVHTRTSTGVALFRHLVKSLLAAPASQKAALRKAVVARLLSAREPYSCIEELLDVCSSAASPERLDVAIDALSRTGQLVLRYTWDYFVRDVQQWNPYSARAYQPNDDHWHILLRAVARCAAPEDARLRLIGFCRNAAQRGIMESVIEALGDLGSDQAHEILRNVAGNHDDLFIRKLARDVLADVE
jgi:hypothetical protein